MQETDVKYYANFIDNNEATELFNELKNIVPWTHGVYNMFGKSVKTPRLLYAMKDKDINITASYKVTGSMEWTPKILKLKEKIEDIIKQKITYAQLNYYRDGNDYIGWHTDSEAQNGDVIASISLGATRKFMFRNIKDKNIKYTYNLEHGSLIVLSDNAAKFNWKHTLPKMKNVSERINITFRPK